MSRPQKTFMEQFGSAMSRAYLWERCREVTRVLPMANTSKELSVAFVQICADIFGYAAGGNPGLGWNLTSLARNQSSTYSQYSSPRDYLAVFSFLSSSGPMIDLIHKLLPDPSNVYEYPITQLPNVSITNNPYATQMGGSLHLSSFEYFFYHFFNLPIRVQIQSVNNGLNNNSNNPTDTIYPILLEDYMVHLLPIDPLQQSKLFSQNIHSHQNTSPVSSPAPAMLHQSPAPSSQTRPSLFRKDFSPTLSSSIHHSGESNSIAQNATSNVTGSNARETWRLDTLVRIISIFWLEPFALESSKNYKMDPQSHMMTAPSEDSYVTASLKVAASLPTIELMRYVRMFIKHAHYFSNSCRTGAGTMYLPSSLKIQIFGEHIHTDVMFHFFRHSIGHWPLDASFKFLLETWLSYIQPWRYVQTPQGQIADENSATSMDHPEKWIPFLKDNFQFYNNLLGQVLTRFLKQDLCSSKNAYMIFRIFKVFSQDNLMPTLQTVSTLLLGTYGSPSHKTPSFPNILQNQRTVQNLAMPSSWDPLTECEYPNIFAQDFRNFISQILLKILESKLNERESLNKRKMEIGAKLSKANNASLATRIFSFFAGTNGSTTSNDSEISEREKLLQNLDFCVDRISDIFNLRQIVEEYEDHFFEEKRQNDQRDVMQQQTTSLNRDEMDLSNVEGIPGVGLSPVQRLDMINKKIKPDGRYLGNPDLIPIRTDEFTIAVRLLHKLSERINGKWGDVIADFYHRTSPAGALCRQICAPPTSYLAKSQDNFGRRLHRLPPRIVLRPFASYRVIFYLSLFCFISLFILGKSSFATLFYLLLVFAIYFLANAFIFNPIDPDTGLSNESFNNSHQKWN